ncbi:response regulator transcription factor [Lactiplantibacillus nangangensis]|uniref:Response regulator transcription factor n=1 Tax=Lactiplantibacillus nangangensis TaxID=2559917 RepID=A0ABW1SNW5_9LACO|nr:LytTR family DNA-binding domain-containing protein [Lactiplantibacillus nangangensis]
MFPIIICEDNKIQLEQLTTIVKNYVLFHNEDFQLALSASKPSTCLEYLSKEHPSNGIYLLDIDLNADMNGIELASKIRVSDVQAKLVFITTHDEMAPITLKYKLEALGFISKDQPIEKIRDELIENLILASARSIAVSQAKQQNFSFAISSQIYNLPLNELLFIEPSDIPHRLKIHTKTGEYEFYGKLGEVNKRYPQLFRSAKSALINVDNITQYDGPRKLISFENALTCKCSITKVKELKHRMKIER